MNNPNSLKEIFIVKNEAKILSHYLIGSCIEDKEASLYSQALTQKNLVFEPYEERLWRLMLKNTLLISSIDAGLAILKPNCVIRERICVMLAILETHPAFFNLFIMDKRASLREWIELLSSMALTPFRAFIGIVIIKFY